MAMNTSYLGTPGAGANQNSSAATTVLSDLSTGQVDCVALRPTTIDTASAVSFGNVTAGTVSIGGGDAIVQISTITVPLVATTVTATNSVTTTHAFSGAKAPATANGTGSDTYIVGLSSGVSLNVQIEAYSSATDVITLKLSNNSTVNAAQDATTIRVTRLEI